MFNKIRLLGSKMPKNSAGVLEISPNATLPEVKEAYFSLLKEYSPDTDPDFFSELRRAYRNLLSETRLKKETLIFEKDQEELELHRNLVQAHSVSEDLLDMQLWGLITEVKSKDSNKKGGKL